MIDLSQKSPHSGVCMGTLGGHNGSFIWGLESVWDPSGVIGGRFYKAVEVYGDPRGS